MKLKEIITTLDVMAALPEEDFRDEKQRFAMIAVDRKDAEALKRAAEILRNVSHVRKLLGTEGEE
ncbi:MAG: hypothetical protein IKF16_02165 [Lachnospiraceae bacterium]|nr:hypothetical protein [Lachnospiraceae bacterium]